jgi:hypothetical protein
MTIIITQYGLFPQGQNILLYTSYQNIFLHTTGPTFAMTHNDKSQLKEERTIKKKKEEETDSKIPREGNLRSCGGA